MHLGDRQKSATEDTLMVCEQACSNCFHNGCTKVGHVSTCWCLRREHYLHAKNLREAAALHEQLLRQLAGGALLPAEALPRSPAALKPPSQKVLLVLQHAIAAGWADQVLASMCMLAFISHLSACLGISGDAADAGSVMLDRAVVPNVSLEKTLRIRRAARAPQS